MENLDNAPNLLPDWATAVIVLALAIGFSIAIYLAISKLILALTKTRGAFLRSLFLRVRRLILVALILVALSIANQFSSFPAEAGNMIAGLISAAIVGMFGWVAIVAIDVASSFYLKQYSTESADDLLARKHFTQIRVLRRAVDVLIIIVTIAIGLMAFEPVRQFGVSLFASAGAAGLVVGLAARPVLSNLIAGIQLAITQPIRIKDAVIVEGEWGWIEEITATYVVIKLWDWRRLIVPLSYFMEKPFQNWTRETAQIIGTVYLYVDYSIPLNELRQRFEEIVRESPLWDQNVVNLQVTDFKDSAVEIRMLVSARTSPQAWDLRCEVREKVLAFLQHDLPGCLPRRRILVNNDTEVSAGQSPLAAHRPSASRA
jgi:small-conductance mechanosensitive channel